jgi:hypothetical protein
MFWLLAICYVEYVAVYVLTNPGVVVILVNDLRRP